MSVTTDPFIKGSNGDDSERNESYRSWRESFETRVNADEAKRTLCKHSPYTILGIQKGATHVEIKNAFRRKVIEWYPGKYAHAERERAIFITDLLIAAYSLLSLNQSE